MDTMGDRLRIARAHHDLTQKALAQKITDGGTKIAHQIIQKIESGRIKQSSYLSAIAKGLRVRYEWLSEGLGGMEETNSIDHFSITPPKTFGERVRLARQVNKMTLEMLANKVGMTKQALARIESGKTKKTSSLMELADALGVNVEWLVHGAGEMVKNNLPKQNHFQEQSEIEQLCETVNNLLDRVAVLENNNLSYRLTTLENRQYMGNTSN